MTQENVEAWEFYFDKFDDIYVDPIIFAEFTIVLLCVFLIRYFILYKIEKNKVKNRNTSNLKNIRLYIGEHCILELLAAFFITYCAVKLTHANPESYIINMIAAPIIGILLSIYIDNKILIPIETATGIGNIFNKINNNKKSNDKKESGNNVTININNGTSENIESNTPSMKLSNDGKLGNNKNLELLSEDLADSDNFNDAIIKAINDIKKENVIQTESILEIQKQQTEHKEKMKVNDDIMQNIISDLSILKDSEMINKKIEIKKMIYACLNNGYATPAENDKIILYYQSYISLGGNHEIESLYENHYLKLPIHENNRIANIQRLNEVYNGDTQAVIYYNGNNSENQIGRLYTYGEFDSEYRKNDN